LKLGNQSTLDLWMSMMIDPQGHEEQAALLLQTHRHVHPAVGCASKHNAPSQAAAMRSRDNK